MRVVSQRGIAALLGLLVALVGRPALAHEVRPAYLELRAESDTRFAMMLKLPTLGGRALKVRLEMPTAASSTRRARRKRRGRRWWWAG